MEFDNYRIRPLAQGDISTIAAAMSEAEGYELTDALSSSLEDMRAQVAAYVNHPRKFGHVAVTGADGTVVAFLLAEVRNRLKDTFEDHSIIDTLPVALFPQSGEFCEIFDLWVARDHRRKGLATALKQNLEEFLTARGCGSIYTHTESENRHVLKLNEKLNYSAVRTGPIWDHIERTSLMKKLKI
jgi:ribosomal protein S18 acetylase RimI-like enzyme